MDSLASVQRAETAWDGRAIRPHGRGSAQPSSRSANRDRRRFAGWAQGFRERCGGGQPVERDRRWLNFHHPEFRRRQACAVRRSVGPWIAKVVPVEGPISVVDLLCSSTVVGLQPTTLRVIRSRLSAPRKLSGRLKSGGAGTTSVPLRSGGRRLTSRKDVYAYLRCGTIRADLSQLTCVPSLGTALTVAPGFTPGRPTPSPCPFTASPAAWAAPHAARFRAAFASRSHSQPQREHRYPRTPRSNFASGRHPQPAQVCVEGNQRSASTKRTPRLVHCHASSVGNEPMPAGLADRQSTCPLMVDRTRPQRTDRIPPVRCSAQNRGPGLRANGMLSANPASAPHKSHLQDSLSMNILRRQGRITQRWNRVFAYSRSSCLRSSSVATRATTLPTVRRSSK